MALSKKTYQNLAKALRDEVVEYIRHDDRYYDFLSELISEAITSKLGQIDDEVLVDLSSYIMSGISIETSNSIL